MAADQSAAGIMTAANGHPMPTFGAKGLSSLLGISEAQAEFYYGLAGMGGELGAARQLSSAASRSVSKKPMVEFDGLDDGINAYKPSPNAASGGKVGTDRLDSVVAGSSKAAVPKVTAEGKIDGQYFTDFNQTARPSSQAKANQPTLIADRVNTKIESSGKPLPNANMATAHAEIGVIQQAYNAGKTQGAAMNLKVEGQAVCGYCRGDIAAAAEKAGLKYLEINEVATGKTLHWRPGMRSIKELD